MKAFIRRTHFTDNYPDETRRPIIEEKGYRRSGYLGDRGRIHRLLCIPAAKHSSHNDRRGRTQCGSGDNSS